MPSLVALTVNGVSVEVAPGRPSRSPPRWLDKPCRTSVSGKPRGPLCGMGICFECRVTINGISHCRSCQILCEPGMDVSTDE